MRLRSVREIAEENYVLWAMNCSYYSAQLRSYLIKKNIKYVEINPSHPEYNERVVPQVGHFTLPILEGPNGELVADSIEAIEFLEGRFPQQTMIPACKVMAGLAWLIHNCASERHFLSAVYDRWKTTVENREFALGEFCRSLETKAVIEAKRKAGEQKLAGEVLAAMASKHVDAAGVTDRRDEVFALYALLNEHFHDYPYILGGHPSIADFGMVAFLYPHVGRDPSSSALLKLHAPALYRWIETMNRAVIVDPEIWYVSPEFFTHDDLPKTLIALTKAIVAFHGPELRATIAAYNHWLDLEPNRPAGAIISRNGKKLVHQVLNEVTESSSGDLTGGIVFLDPLALHLRLIDLEKSMSATQMNAYKTLLRSLGAGDFIEVKLKRKMRRKDYAYVLD
ncbi:MAG: glutathione S-transferase family protein [Pseudomonadota bacterium]